MRRREERGAGTVLTGCVALCVCVAMLVGCWVAGWVGSIHRARAAADLSALAAARSRTGHPSADTRRAVADACASASGLARRNDARMVRCTVEGNRRDVVARVEVEVLLTPRVGGRDRWVKASAVAGTQPRG